MQLELFGKSVAGRRRRVGLAVASLQSGSEGNATLVSAGATTLLVDCGISPARLSERLAALGRTLGSHDSASLGLRDRCSIGSIAGVLVTHEHADHAGGCGALARKHGVPLYMTEGTARAAAERILAHEDARARISILPASGRLAFRDGRPVDLAEPHDLACDWIPVPHDAREPVAFALERDGFRAGFLTDVGHASRGVRRFFEGLDLALLESNHCRDRLRAGPYPASLKRRIASSLGHLSNEEAARLVADHASPRLATVLLAHISKVNNAPALAQSAVRERLAKRRDLSVDLRLTFPDRPAPVVLA